MTNETGDREQETTKRGKRKKRRQNKADQATTYEERLNVGREAPPGRHGADF